MSPPLSIVPNSAENELIFVHMVTIYSVPYWWHEHMQYDSWYLVIALSGIKHLGLWSLKAEYDINLHPLWGGFFRQLFRTFENSRTQMTPSLETVDWWRYTCVLAFHFETKEPHTKLFPSCLGTMPQVFIKINKLTERAWHKRWLATKFSTLREWYVFVVYPLIPIVSASKHSTSRSSRIDGVKAMNSCPVTRAWNFLFSSWEFKRSNRLSISVYQCSQRKVLEAAYRTFAIWESYQLGTLFSRLLPCADSEEVVRSALTEHVSPSKLSSMAPVDQAAAILASMSGERDSPVGTDRAGSEGAVVSPKIVVAPPPAGAACASDDVMGIVIDGSASPNPSGAAPHRSRAPKLQVSLIGW